MATVAGQLVREMVKRNNSILAKQFGRGTAGVRFGKEPSNLFHLNSYSHSWLANKKRVTILPVGNDLSVLLATTETKKQNKPAALLQKSVINKEFHWMEKAVENRVSDNYYNTDLKKAALANVMRHKTIPGIETYAQPGIAANNAFGNVQYHNVMVLRSPIMIESSPAAIIESSPVLKKMNYRFYSNNSNDINKSDLIYYNSNNRPLSPHLSVYKPQLSSMFSIFNRISGSFLSAVVLSFYLLFKMGFICFTYGNFYQFFFLSEKFILIPAGLTASLALSYHIAAALNTLRRSLKFAAK